MKLNFGDKLAAKQNYLNIITANKKQLEEEMKREQKRKNIEL